jgi:Rod binding domain-containing protein
VDKTGRFNRLKPSFQRQLKNLANDFYQKHQTPLILTDTLRTKAEQAQVHREKPNLALPADHPNAMHPRGLAVDVDLNQAEKITPEMLAKYGLHLPALSKGETWHIEPKIKPSGSPPSSQRALAYGKSFAPRTLRQPKQLSASLNLLREQGLAAGGATDDRSLLQAAMEVEAIFLGQLLDHGRRALVDPVSQNSQQMKGYLSMADRHLARSLAAGGGLGLAAKIIQDLARTESHPQKEHDHEANPPVSGRTDGPERDLPLPGTS